MAGSASKVNVVFIGGGPAGLAPLLAAHRYGQLDDLLNAGVVVVEQSEHLGAGDIGAYAINSDSTGNTFVDCLQSAQDTALTALQSHPLAKTLAALGEGPAPLSLVGQFMGVVGKTLGAMIAARQGCAVKTKHQAISVQRHAAGWKTTIVDQNGRVSEIISRNVVSATGATQPYARLAADRVGGRDIVASYKAKLLQSGEVLTRQGLDMVAARLRGKSDPRVAILGGSTSAAAVADALLHRLPSITFGEAAVTLLHRSNLGIYYASAELAHADGYTAFSDDDICPVSKRVFRFAGFRLDSRELIMSVLGIGGRPRETRVRLHRLTQNDQDLPALLDRADLVIAALGYQPNAIPVHDMAGDPIKLHVHQSPRARLVDSRCRILDANMMAIPGLFGMGLAAGFKPTGSLGGEPSFKGQANGLWLWQNDVGLIVVDALLAGIEEPVAAPDMWETLTETCEDPATLIVPPTSPVGAELTL